MKTNPAARSSDSRRKRLSTLNRILPGLLVLAAWLGSLLQGLAAPRQPLPPLPEAIPPLYRETFDWALRSGASEAELLIPNYGTLHESFSGYALQRVGPVTPLIVPAIDSAGRTNVACDAASAIRCWIIPNWSSQPEGKGPGVYARLVELIVADEKGSAAVWSLQVAPDGAGLVLLGSSDTGPVGLLEVPICWTAGQAHCVALNYGPKTELFIDGQLAASGGETLAVPAKVAALVWGSTASGDLPAGADMDDLCAFRRPLPATSVAIYWNALRTQAALGPVSADELAQRQTFLQAALELAAQAKAETGAGDSQMMLLVGGASQCITNVPVHLTNIITTFDTNLGWTVRFDMQGGTNGRLYDVFMTTNLTGNKITNSQWTWLERGPTCSTYQYTNQPGAMAFYVIGLTNDIDGDLLSDAFERLVSKSNPAQSDTDGDGLPDAWEWQHFGSFEQTASEDYDGDGMSNWQEYQDGSDPNTITFTAHFGYGYFSTMVITGSLEVLGGVPAQMAILVDSSNRTAAVWQAPSTTPVVTLPAVEGEHQILLGLKGRAPDSWPIWLGMRVTLDQTPPAIVITSPVQSTVTKPIIQLLGYSDEKLWAVSCTLSNVAGTGQANGFLTREPDHFQCFDLPLTNGPNAISLQIRDYAGNSTMTNFVVIYDTSADTNAPALTLYWPQNGDQIAAPVFTLRGLVDDETAAVTAVVLGSSGTTNVLAGNIERNGALWVEGIPLEPGTNTLLLTMTDAAGNLSTTNLTVIQSDLQLTIDDVPAQLLNEPTVTVAGTISDPGYKVWVNGVAATLNGNAWTATSVPTTDGGTAIFAVTAIPLSDNDGNGSPPSWALPDPAARNPGSTGARAGAGQPEKPSEVRLVRGSWEIHEAFGSTLDLDYAIDYAWRWDDTNAGYAEKTVTEWHPDPVAFGLRYWIATNGQQRFEQWEDSPTNVVDTEPVDLGLWFWQGFILKGPRAKGTWDYVDDWGYLAYQEKASGVSLVLRTGGRQSVAKRNLFVVTGSAWERILTGLPWWEPDWYLPRQIPFAQVFIPGIEKTLGADGRAYAVLPDNAEFLLTPQAPPAYFTFNVEATKHIFTSTCFASIPTNRARSTLGVGEQVSLRFIPDPPILAGWVASAGGVSPAAGLSTTFTAPSNGTPSVTVRANFPGASLTNTYAVVEPSGFDGAKTQVMQPADCWPVPPVQAAAGMHLRVVMAPTNVSFYRVQVLEVGQDASNVEGWFSIYGAPPHDSGHGANQWYQLGYDNAWNSLDHAWGGIYNPPWSGQGWSGGSFTWNIPFMWKIGTGTATQRDGWQQNFSLSAGGTVTVTKFGHTVVRAPNENCGTAQ